MVTGTELDDIFAAQFSPPAAEPAAPVVDPATPVAEPPVAQVATPEPPVVVEPIATPAPVVTVDEPVVDDDEKFTPVGVYNLLGDEPQAPVATPVPPPQAAPQPGVDPEFLALLKNKLGVDASDFASAKAALENYKTPTIAGYDEVVSAAIQRGDITIEELAANKVHDFSVLPIDEAALYHFMDLGLTEEKAQAHVEGLDETTKEIFALQFKREQSRSREAILQQAKAQRDQRAVEEQGKRSHFKSEVIATAKSLTPETININGFKPAQAEATQISRYMEAIADNPQLAMELMLGKNPGDLAINLAKILYPDRIQEEAFKRGKNKAVAATIREAQNPSTAAPKGTPPTANPVGKFSYTMQDLIGK